METTIIATTLAAAGITTPGAVDAILRKVMYGEPIPPDYAHEVLRCIDLLQDVVMLLDGPALGLKVD